MKDTLDGATHKNEVTGRLYKVVDGIPYVRNDNLVWMESIGRSDLGNAPFMKRIEK